MHLYIIYMSFYICKPFFCFGGKMNKTAFIISEYDPFHNGHLYHIRQTRAAGAETVVCLLSGNFMQRGTPAFFNKYDRAEMALKNGADLVLELPLRAVLGGAHNYAVGASEILKALHASGTLSFGASASVDKLRSLHSITETSDFSLMLHERIMQTGENYAAAFARTAKLFSDKAESILSDPNNVLALEYMRAVSASGAPIDFFAVQRVGAIHDGNDTYQEFASAKRIREELRSALDPSVVSGFLPESSFEIIKNALINGRAPADMERYELVTMVRLLMMDKEELGRIEGVNQGLENRIIQELKTSASLTELLDNVKMKRFTYARLRRIVCAAALGLKKADPDEGIGYIRVLGFREPHGREALNRLRQSTSVPLLTNLSDAPDGPDKETEIRAGKLYELLLPAARSCNPEICAKPVIITGLDYA